MAADSYGAAAEFTLWHSAACHSAWAEYDSAGASIQRMESLLWIDQYGGPGGSYEVPVDQPGNHPTPMVSWDRSVNVCSANAPVNACSGWR
jgi:hypothetical protein